MKVKIIISGQIAGNFKLRSACMTSECEEKKTMFNGFSLKFQTKREARKAMKDGFKYLKSEEPDFHKEGGISMWNDQLSYDASNAKIVPCE